MPRAKSLIAVCLLGSVLAACDRYVDRRDQVTFGSGDAVAANRAMHIIDPWPRASQSVEQGISGEQAEGAMEKFRRRASGRDSSQAPATITLSPTPAAAPRP
jgi:hypothetical protein